MADPSTFSIVDNVTYGGMAVGAGIAALLIRLGWKKPTTPETEVAISGQATIVDTAPLKELLKNVDLLTLQWQKVSTQIDINNQLDAALVEKLGQLLDLMADYFAEQRMRQAQEDKEEEIERRAEARARELLEEQQKKPRARGHVSET